ncbi:hypothetical protein Amn_pc00750 (plasmid) [Aminobacter sp. Y103A]|nr:hypothetical protein Amn_pc00750 [Aminobacter sp. SS-2016]
MSRVEGSVGNGRGSDAEIVDAIRNHMQAVLCFLHFAYGEAPPTSVMHQADDRRFLAAPWIC